MSLFDRYIMVDWAGGSAKSSTPQADAIWTASIDGTRASEPQYFRSRQMVEPWLVEQIDAALRDNARLCIGFDFPFAYPYGFGKALTGRSDPFALWSWLDACVEDSEKHNNRFDLAGKINATFDAPGPFWGNGLKRDIKDLPRKKPNPEPFPFAERRHVEKYAPGSFTCWQMSGAGAVGGQVFMGLPVLQRLRRAFPDDIAVWPFEPLEKPVAFVEIWPSLLKDQISAEMKQLGKGAIKDAVQVQVTARVVAQMDANGSLGQALSAGDDATHEGWILGIGAEDALKGAAQAGPRLPDDCFALPPGVSWTPFDEALARLDRVLHPVVDPVLGVPRTGEVLASNIVAPRDNPPVANAAVDGYGFQHGTIQPGQIPLVNGRAAAGAPYPHVVPEGQAIRILTGAALPDGVDTIVLEEDCTLNESEILCEHLPIAGANTRAAGEDVSAGEQILGAGRVLKAPDLALLAAVGLSEVKIFKRLRVGVLSTGDELIVPGVEATPYQTYDANRPMLLSLLERWGYRTVDLGHVRDDRSALRTRLHDAAARCDAVMTTGGASAGDEDHVSALLRAEGQLSSWRIAIKPGRPLVLAQWQGVPIFGLPGNPVAAFVCALMVARPALSKLSGAPFTNAQGFMAPAAFEKRKKPGRREFLRARLTPGGQIEVYGSEGSGLVSGLSWADGLVELPDKAFTVRRGDMVRFLPYAEFGL